MPADFGVGFEVHHRPAALRSGLFFKGDVGNTLDKAAIRHVQQYRAFAQASRRAMRAPHHVGAQSGRDGLGGGGHFFSIGANNPALEGDRAGDFVSACIEPELQQRAASGRSPAGDVVPRLAAGLAAYARGNYGAAIATLEPALSETVRIGGSRAQRDLIENTLLAAYLKALDRGAPLCRQPTPAVLRADRPVQGLSRTGFG